MLEKIFRIIPIFAFHFWNWAGFLIFIYTIYLSFTSEWWWFIVGLIVFSVIWKSNQKSNSENILEEAFRDKDFYDRVFEIDGWLYEIEETEAEKYLN